MEQNIINLLIDRLGKEKVLSQKAIGERYEHIWRMDIPLKAKAVVFPKSTEDVSVILKICHEYNQPVIVHGGLTGLVGGTETTIEEVVISMEKMNQIEEVDEKSRTMTVEAGVILEQIHEAAEEKELLFPLNYGAKGSAQIGGAISTNAGGLRVFRYGMTRNLVVGLEAVLADGTIISSMKKIIKDNSAYDLKQLFIGSEGTLGIVTRAILKLKEAPKSRNSALIGLNDYENVVNLLRFMDARLVGTLSSFELIWANTYKALTNEYSSVKPPLSYGYQYYVLLETLGSNQEKDTEKLFVLVEEVMDKEIIKNAVFAETEADLTWLWKIREDVRVIEIQSKNTQQFDISLPIPLIGKKIEEIIFNLNKLPEVEACYAFGHVADGNIHLHISKSEDNEALKDRVNNIIYSPLKIIGGSISAEHGIGVHKKNIYTSHDHQVKFN